MIRIVEGVPGSGKSYYAMKYLIKYCEYHKLYDEFVVRPDVLIISNISGLRIKHKNLDELLEKRPVEDFFTVENMERIQAQYHVKNIILVIDEAQKIFDSKFYNKEVFYLFQYHRHIGLDIFFITQARSTLPRHLLPLSEFIIQAVPRSKGFLGTFRYRFIDQKGVTMYTSVLKKDQTVFRAYKSFVSDEIEKPKNLMVKYFVMIGVLVVVCGFLWKGVFMYYKTNAGPKSAEASTPNVYVPKTPEQRKVEAVNFVQQKYSSVSSAVPSLSEVKDKVGIGWQVVNLDGYVNRGETTVIMIQGKSITLPDRRVRSVDLRSLICEANVDALGLK